MFVCLSRHTSSIALQLQRRNRLEMSAAVRLCNSERPPPPDADVYCECDMTAWTRLWFETFLLTSNPRTRLRTRDMHQLTVIISAGGDQTLTHSAGREFFFFFFLTIRKSLMETSSCVNLGAAPHSFTVIDA